MKQTIFIAIFALVALTGVYTVITLYDSNLKIGRMYQTPVVRPYEEPLLVTDERTVAFTRSEAMIKEELKHTYPVIPTGQNKAFLEKGEKEYKTFCSHCHGNFLDGLGTVGQSFHPLPTNLTGEKAIRLTDKELFNTISYGTKRTPALASSMSVESREAVIGYIRHMQQITR